MTVRAACILPIVLILPGIVPGRSVAGDAGPERARVEFNRQIRPILADKCFACHGPDSQHRQASLRLDTSEGARADLGGRRAIVPGSPADSELLSRITDSDDSLRMPPPETRKALSQTEADLIRRWITEGAEYQAHWSYAAPKRPVVPDVTNDRWSRNAIDRFILVKLKEEGIEPSLPAGPPALLRRLSFDLTGLPPDVALDQLIGAPEAWELIVDRLLSSPRFGERMAMYWLDLVRYADTVGYHGDQEHPATLYRDYVISAFNRNLPFDQFTVEQLAGDLLAEATIEQKIASGYNRLLQTSHEGGVQVKEYLHKYDADRARNLGSVWMGATLGCVECHDHKYDPYTQRDYYRLVAFFADVDDLRTFKGGDTNPTRREPELVVYSRREEERLLELKSLIAALEAGLEEGVGGSSELVPARNEVKKQIAAYRKEIGAIERGATRSMVTESVAPRVIRVLARGDWMDEAGEIVEPAIPGFLPANLPGGRRLSRLDLARWLTSPEHPQTARVFVNRLWYLFLGNGLCNTLEDTGSQGEWPTHPELLDWLASEFVSSGWDVKHIVRLIVTSSTYRQSSAQREDLKDRDPHNRLYARQTSTRLPAEMIRDQALAVSGLLVERVGGRKGHPYQPAGYYKHLNFPRRDYQPDRDEYQYRRGVYVHWQRQYLHPMLKAFDAPSREECTARRPVSNTPLGALVLLNDPSFVEAARALAILILREKPSTDSERLKFAWRRTVLRDPTEDELELLTALLKNSRDTYRESPESASKYLAVGLAPLPEGADPIELAAWTTVARALFNLHETITRD